MTRYIATVIGVAVPASLWWSFLTVDTLLAPLHVVLFWITVAAGFVGYLIGSDIE